MEPFILKKDPIEHLTIEKWGQLLPNLSVGFTTRNGGFSKYPYHANNMALHVSDDDVTVIKNRVRLTTALNFSFHTFTAADQIHGNQIAIITDKNKGKGRDSLEDTIQNTDGLVTNQPDILLTSFYADCVPLFFLDPIKKVVGLAHAGWKGTVLKIATNMVDAMKETFQSNEKDIKVAIGPSIGQCCYEVNDVVIEPLITSMNKIPQGAIINKNNGHYDLDLNKINQQILIDAGILPNNIELSSWCTSCNSQLFYSHRKEHGKTGRMASWIGLRKDG